MTIRCLVAFVIIVATNSTAGKVTPILGPHCVLAIALASQALPPPGNPDHQEPGVGQNCSRELRTPADHLCGCHRECKSSETDDGTPSVYVQEDAQCRVYCYKSHCKCPIANCE